LQQQRRLTRAGVAADQNRAPRHHAAAEHAANSLKPVEKRGSASRLISESFCTFDTPALPAYPDRRSFLATWRRSGNAHLGDGIPGMTGAALPLPARIIRTAFITDKCAFWSFRHDRLALDGKKAGGYFNQQIVEPVQGKNGPLGYLRLTLDTHTLRHRSAAGR
jgi:hypothetical protein